MSQYDAFALDYAQHAANSPYNVQYERPAMTAQLPDLRGKLVLDAGCASGEFIPELLKRGARVTALDVSGELLAIVRERFDDRVSTMQADLNADLPLLADGSFDLIMSSLTIHYIENLHRLFAEFRRVVKPGGELLFSTHHPAMTTADVTDYFRTQLVTDTWKMGERDVEVQYYHRSFEALIGPLLQAGFHIDAILEPPCFLQPGRPWFLVVKACTRLSQ